MRPRSWAALTAVRLCGALFAAACASGGTVPPPPVIAYEPTPPEVAPAEPPPAIDETSVSPGINSPYFRSDAVERYTSILEAESREIVERRRAIVSAMGLTRGMVVADIGAGTGLLTLPMAKRVGPGGKVFAVDIVPVFLERISERADAAGLDQIETVQGTERSTGLPPASIDLAFMCDTYHHIEFPMSYMRSVFDTLRPGSTLLLIDLERIEGKTSPARLRHVRANKDTVIDEVSQVGFVLEREIDLLEENYYLRFKRP